MKIIVSANTSFNLVNFRLGLINALRKNGHEIILYAPLDEYTEELKSAGYNVVEMNMDRRGRALHVEARTLLKTWEFVKKTKPDVILSFTIKNNIYLGLVGRLIGIPIIPNVTGLGTAFSDSKGIFSFIVRRLYRLAFRTSPVVYFQNPEDRKGLVAAGVLEKDLAHVLPGSGVNLEKFKFIPLTEPGNSPVFLLVARLLWEKGIGEFVEAARMLRKSFPEARFWLLGGMEQPDKTVVPVSKIKEWEAEGLVEYLGTVRDVIPIISQAHCIVLPSYYKEGTPRVLLEAAASGRPIITTDMPGCRDVVQNGTNGYLVTPRDHVSLAEAMQKIACLDFSSSEEMCRAGRALVKRRFDEKFVIETYLEALEKIEKTYK